MYDVYWEIFMGQFMWFMIMILDDVDFHLQNNLDQSQNLQTCTYTNCCHTYVNVCSLDLRFHLLSLSFFVVWKAREENVVHILTCYREI